MESALYGVYTLVVLYQKSHSFASLILVRHNSCVNAVRAHFLWSILYLNNQIHACALIVPVNSWKFARLLNYYKKSNKLQVSMVY